MKYTLFICTFCSVFSMAQQNASGYVFEDSNRNGLRDRKEKGIANVAVSNGSEVVLTDKNGRYEIPVQDDNIIFVVKPTNYATKTGKNNLPEYYYIHKPNGSPKGFKYGGVKATGPLPAEISFPLYPRKEDKNFQILVFGDPQPYDLKELDYFRRGIINEVKGNRKKAVFGITLGDLVGNDLSLHQPYIAAMQELGLPWYNIIGNHDMDFEAQTDKDSDETFEANFGPANYAFNYGNVHFIMLDDILYPDPRDGKGYWGGFREDQLEFLKNDLKYVDKNKLIVLSFHIQMKPDNENDYNFRMEDRQKVFDLLKPFPNILMMSAHTHKQSQLEYTEKDGWQGVQPLHEYNAGTTSGDWYSGTTGEQGVPESVMRDGTFRGYSFIDFSDNKYNIRYKVAGQPEDFQIGLWVPKVIPFDSRNSARIVANFFMGSHSDTVEYRIDKGEWKKMDYTETQDPAYLDSLLKWDTTNTLFPGRRPSNPDSSRHIWTAGFPRKLALGKHEVEVRAKDRYGNEFSSKENFEVSAPVNIP